MERDYRRTWSPALGRDMEILRFGTQGRPLVAFPTSQGRFYQWEDFGLVESVAARIDSGELNLWCVDTVDSESWYAPTRPPAQRVARHLEYERYLVQELFKEIGQRPVCAGPSFGAFHAALLTLRHPDRVLGFISLSGVYDPSRWLDGYSDESTYLTNPLAFVPNLTDERYLAPLRDLPCKVIVTGQTDPNVRDSLALADALRQRGVGVKLDLWPGWAHDWQYWKEMLRLYA
ncbi:MAG: esterase family protein [Candidatus Dormibacteraeota bacterium]|uniref:Esterase family protein n=1 Tax=Candidatus Dormiibacter inghamiae TaxID=3127013 RepID=A0A934NHN0_9BACT|nr:esterase family protein [Candidatus Dormibacteraeota bacterium]MBJ7607235.1 esterase family protein [Candidatus Dormibacteraeota bacterium]